MKKLLTIFVAALALASCSTDREYDVDTFLAATDASVLEARGVPAGTYKLDPTHASLTFKVNHLGLSRYTARFTRFDANLNFDPQNPRDASVAAVIDPRSLETDFPLATPDFDGELAGKDWLDADQFPKITFRSTNVTLTGNRTARLKGEMTMHGITRPLEMSVAFNGGYAALPMGEKGARIGFSAKGVLRRSDFGISKGIPEKGSALGVSDLVTFAIEAEFIKPEIDATKQG